MEDLARQIADVINEADPATRQDLREYATDLLRAETETTDRAPVVPGASARSTNPLALALLLGALSLPMLLLFLPLGLMMAAAAVVLGLVGIGMTVLRR